MKNHDEKWHKLHIDTKKTDTHIPFLLFDIAANIFIMFAFHYRYAVGYLNIFH